MRILHPRHPNMGRSVYHGDCEHCLAGLLAEQIDGQELHVEHSAWRHTGQISQILPEGAGKGLFQKEMDRVAVKAFVRGLASGQPQATRN